MPELEVIIEEATEVALGLSAVGHRALAGHVRVRTKRVEYVRRIRSVRPCETLNLNPTACSNIE